MPEVDLLRSLPRTSRDVTTRAIDKSPEVIATSREFGREYFDGDRKYGYGGYYYDGRWRPVVRDIMTHYGLPEGAKVLDVGCAKGFLVHDFVVAGVPAWGVDISPYAVVNAHGLASRRVRIGNAVSLPYPDKVFDLALSINTIHNLDRPDAVQALRELSRVSKAQFIQVDSYRTDEERERFEAWVLTARFHGTPADWAEVFDEAEYTGDYAWTIV